jgi:hypothetical protein
MANNQLELSVEPRKITVYLGFQFDSLKSRMVRFSHKLLLKLRGKSNGPYSLTRNVLNSDFDVFNRGLEKVARNSRILWLPEPAIDLYPDSTWELIDSSKVWIGPSFDVFNEKIRERLSHSKRINMLVPSNWVADLMQTHYGLDGKRIYTWFAGVNTEFWDGKRHRKPSTLLIYLKSNLSQDELATIIQVASKFELGLQIMKYGEYRIHEYRRKLRKSVAVVWIGSTESQCIAQFEAWAMDVPTLIRNCQKFDDSNLGSPSPYLQPQTGVLTGESKITAAGLIDFLERLDSFAPRNWVLQNATTQISRSNLTKLLFRSSTS